MSSCNGNCSECGSDCADRKPESLLAELNPNASVKKVIAVVSGKGGVGKSTVTSMSGATLSSFIFTTSCNMAYSLTDMRGVCVSTSFFAPWQAVRRTSRRPMHRFIFLL